MAVYHETRIVDGERRTLCGRKVTRYMYVTELEQPQTGVVALPLCRNCKESGARYWALQEQRDV